ncbi:MAG: CpaF family protein [Bacteriovoracaceae bacterium]|nr:CpaF family protein [Bacteriovoracaceae bacterium]
MSKDRNTSDIEKQNLGLEIGVNYKNSDGVQFKHFSKGKHLIGSSSFANIKINYDDSNICASLKITEKDAYLKCIAATPTIYHDGKLMTIGEELHIGERLNVVIARTLVTLSLYQHGEIVKDEDEDLDEVEKYIKNIDRDSVKLVKSLSIILQNELDLSIANIESASQETNQKASAIIRKKLSHYTFPENAMYDRDNIEQRTLDEVLGLGPLEPLLADESISEIMVNSRDQIFIEKAGKLTLSDIGFSSEQALLNVIERIVSSVGRRIDTSSPIVDARLLDGSRVNAIIQPLALKGASLTIRKFSKSPITVDKLIDFGAFDQNMGDFLKFLVESHKNIIISGGTGSGKTTLLNALSGFIPNGERIITVEDSAELQLQQDHVVSLETRPPNLEGKGEISIRRLIKNTLRMRPDRIIVGECRGGEALDMLQAMNTGHDGSMTTGHANSPEDMLRRLETMTMMSGMELPLAAIREQITSAVSLIIQQTRRKTGRRLITAISWVKELDRDTGMYITVKLFSRNKRDDIIVHSEAIKDFYRTEAIDGDYRTFIPDLAGPLDAGLVNGNLPDQDSEAPLCH